MWALGDSTQVHLHTEPSLWPPDSLLLKVATKSTAVYHYDSPFRKYCKLSVKTCKTPRSMLNPVPGEAAQSTCGLWFKGQWASLLAIYYQGDQHSNSVIHGAIYIQLPRLLAQKKEVTSFVFHPTLQDVKLFLLTLPEQMHST